MSNQVFANNMEVSCKAADGKSICAFPDVCFTPPETPATPPGVPIPYPNTGMASDCTDGSSTVKISGQEVMLKNKSYFKKSTGDEAGCATKKGVLTSKNTGKVYFNSWSMDVKVEGENVVRNLDLTTHNHGSFPSNTATWPYADSTAFGPGGACSGISTKFKLVPYKSKDANGEDCYTCAPETGHHLIPGRCMKTRMTNLQTGAALKEPTYPEGCSHDKAPCVCVDNENQYDGTHKECHAIFDAVEYTHAQNNGNTMSYKKARDTAAKSVAGINNGKEPTEKEQECIKTQLDNYYKNCLTNKDGSVSLNSPLNAQGDESGLVLEKLNSTGGFGG